MFSNDIPNFQRRQTMAKIMVTGGAGFIGSHVAEFYAKKGENVVEGSALKNNKRAC